MKNQDSFMPTFKLGLKKYGKLEKLDGIGPILYQKKVKCLDINNDTLVHTNMTIINTLNAQQT